MAQASSLIAPESAAGNDGESRPRDVPGVPRHDRHGADHQLLTLVRAASPGAEERVYERLAPLVNRLVWSTLGPDSEHNDVAHDIFIRIFRNVARLRDPERLEVWAARVALNTIRNEIRRRRSRRWVFWDAAEHAEPAMPAVDLEGRELLARTYRVLAKLSADEQVVLSLVLFTTNNVESIAELTGCSRSTVKRRLRCARDRFLRLSRQDPLLESWTKEVSSPSGDADE
jgi:RNA polymerase sigma-70 factor, ECF subfamily